MKKTALAFALILPLCACNENKTATAEDFIIVQRVLDENPPAQIITSGAMGDFTVYVPQTDELRGVMRKTDSAKPFLSAELAPEHIKDGFCIVDVITQKSMEEQGTPDSKCFYRLYCGGGDVNLTDNYAIEVCKE